MSQSRKQTRQRKRNKTPSPLFANSSKKTRQSEAESSVPGSELDTDSDQSCDFEPTEKPGVEPATVATAASLRSTKMGLSDDDLNKIGGLFSAKLKTELISDIKSIVLKEISMIKNEIVSEVKLMISDELRSVREENVRLRGEVKSLKLRVDAMASSQRDRDLQVDDLEQYGRRMCLEVSNIPGDTGDPSEDVSGKLLRMAEKVRLPDGSTLGIKSDDIDRCHRRGRQKAMVNRKIIIKFSNSTARQKVYSARKLFGDGIFVVESLTRLRESLSYQCRQMTKGENPRIANTWISGGRVMCKLTGNETKFHVRDQIDIDSIKAGGKPVR